jgi:hypothetical protein
MRHSVLGALVIALLTSCSADSGRRADYLSSHRETDPAVARAIEAGAVRSGMTEAEVRASWGPPSVVHPSSEGRSIWTYSAGRSEIGEMLGIHTVVFENGRVVSVAASR